MAKPLLPGPRKKRTTRTTVPSRIEIDPARTEGVGERVWDVLSKQDPLQQRATLTSAWRKVIIENIELLLKLQDIGHLDAVVLKVMAEQMGCHPIALSTFRIYRSRAAKDFKANAERLKREAEREAANKNAQALLKRPAPRPVPSSNPTVE